MAPTSDPAATTGKRPRLYLTEFGYHNQPTRKRWRRHIKHMDSHHVKSNMYWHMEQRRANWFAGFNGALNKAARSEAIWLSLYHAVEDSPTALQPDNPKLDEPHEGASNDYGLVGLPRAEEAGWDIVGKRPYGRNRNERPTSFRTAQDRKAYCAIRRWAILEGYFGEKHKTRSNGFPPEHMNRCPRPNWADDAD